MFSTERFYIKKLNDSEVKNSMRFKSQTGWQLCRTLGVRNVRHKQHEPWSYEENLKQDRTQLMYVRHETQRVHL
jgi:hypothetical protein